MDIHVFLVLVLAAVLAGFAWWLVVLIGALRTPKAQWDAAGQNQLAYVVLMVFAGLLGTLVYVVVARPRLRAVQTPTP